MGVDHIVYDRNEQGSLSHMKAAFDQTFEQRLAKVDLTAVMAHVAEDTGLDADTLILAEDLYRKFLTLKSRYAGETIVPPRLVDLVWHTHITFTRQYMADCELLFGEYLHHTPMDDDTTALYQNGTVVLMARDFGINLSAYSQLRPELMRAGPCA